MRRWILVAAFFLGSACTGPTQIVVMVETDYPREALTHVDVFVDGPADTQRAGVDVGPTEPAFPLTVGLLAPDDRPDAQIGIRAVGTLGAPLPFRDPIEQEVVTRFVPGESRVVVLELELRCYMVDCPEAQTCSNATCVDVHVPPDDLPVWED